jgi:hypothetical protein
MRPDIFQAIQTIDAAFFMTDDFDVAKHNQDFEEIAIFVDRWKKAVEDRKNGPKTPILILNGQYTQRDFYKKQMAEASKIAFDKWIEGERLHCDPGNDFIIAWVKLHGTEFKDKFMKSLCRTCKSCYKCGGDCKDKCDKYDVELYDESKSVLKHLTEELKEAIDKSMKDICEKYKVEIDSERSSSPV